MTTDSRAASLDDRPYCLKEGCPNRVCLGASILYCYSHALFDLLTFQWFTIGLHYEALPDHVRQWCDRHEGWRDRNLVEEMEQMMVWLFEHEVNFRSAKWVKCASEIMRRIESDE